MSRYWNSSHCFVDGPSNFNVDSVAMILLEKHETLFRLVESVNATI